MGEEASSGGCGEGLLCCVRSLRKCGEASKARVTNIKSPHYPGPTNYLRNCPAHLHIHPDTCQVRVDLLDFNIGSMINGRCHIHDSLLLKSTIGAKIPLRRLCGHVSDPKYLPDPTHFYIHIPSPLGDQQHFLPNKKDLLRLLTFDFNVKNSSSSWNIRAAASITPRQRGASSPSTSWTSSTPSAPGWTCASRGRQGTAASSITSARWGSAQPTPGALGTAWFVMTTSCSGERRLLCAAEVMGAH